MEEIKREQEEESADLHGSGDPRSPGSGSNIWRKPGAVSGKKPLYFAHLCNFRFDFMVGGLASFETPGLGVYILLVNSC